MELNKILQGNCIDGLKNLPDNSVNCCITSPPYYGLRDYGTAAWEGGDYNCDHQTPDNDLQTAGEKQKTNKGSVRYEKTFCRKCGARRIDSQIGLEETPRKYIENLLKVFAEVKRVLKPDGTLWF